MLVTGKVYEKITSQHRLGGSYFWHVTYLQNVLNVSINK